MNRLSDHSQAVRGEFRYFALYDTPYGAIETTLSRCDENGREGNPDTFMTARVFRPDWAPSGKQGHWHWIASLNYGEIESRDVPKHTDTPEKFLDLLREDGDRLCERAVSILNCTPMVAPQEVA